ncbi:MAG: hypothetical protein H6835_01815 [Planctomycetes bacterium]|nr:hypothetical protein [Planctomycetota bacterium]
MLQRLAWSLVTSLAVIAGAPAQKLSLEQNAGAPWDATFSSWSGYYLVFEVVVAASSPVTAIELPVRVNAASVGSSFYVFDSQATNVPAAHGSWSSLRQSGSWSSVVLDHPVPVAPTGTTLWIGVAGQGLGFELLGTTAGTEVQPRWTVSTSMPAGSAWTQVPADGLAVPVRVHCGTHTGVFFPRGGGVPATDVLGPYIHAIGFPNTGNPVSFLVRRCRAPSLGVLAIGAYHYPALPPFDLVMSTLDVLIPFVTTPDVQTPDHGDGIVGFVLPDDPALANLSVGVQAGVFDPVMSLGMTVTTGFQMRIGD